MCDALDIQTGWPAGSAAQQATASASAGSVAATAAATGQAAAEPSPERPLQWALSAVALHAGGGGGLTVSEQLPERSLQLSTPPLPVPEGGAAEPSPSQPPPPPPSPHVYLASLECTDGDDVLQVTHQAQCSFHLEG